MNTRRLRWAVFGLSGSALVAGSIGLARPGGVARSQPGGADSLIIDGREVTLSGEHAFEDRKSVV